MAIFYISTIENSILRKTEGTFPAHFTHAPFQQHFLKPEATETRRNGELGFAANAGDDGLTII